MASVIFDEFLASKRLNKRTQHLVEYYYDRLLTNCKAVAQDGSVVGVEKPRTKEEKLAYSAPRMPFLEQIAVNETLPLGTRLRAQREMQEFFTIIGEMP